MIRTSLLLAKAPIIVSMLCFFCLQSYALNDKTRVAFFYGDNPPIAELHAYNVVVVHPNSNIIVKQYNNSSSQLYAYVSIGELDSNDSYAKQTKISWRIGNNAVWNSRIMDLANPEWRNFLLTNIITPLWKKGYHGFFLDTLDSYQGLKLPAKKNQEQMIGIIDLVKQIKATYPTASIITNRGFEVLEAIHQDINAVAAESLFAGWDNASKTYTSISEHDRQWLLNQLTKAHQQYQLPIIVIDYLPPNKRTQAQKIAKQISDLGFIPWVSDSFLETLGIGTIEIIPRKILLLYDMLPSEPHDQGIPLYETISVFNYTAFILEYMGFVPILQRVDDTLVDKHLNGTYAGIISWFSRPVLKNHRLLETWLSKQVSAGIPIVFMENFGIPLQSPLLHSLHINVAKTIGPVKYVTISHHDQSIGYEILPKPMAIAFHSIKAEQGNVLLELTASNNQKQDAIAITPWGGYALEPFDIATMPNSQARWIVNPFDFFRKTLRLPIIPIPDVTTENGRRILIAQIDGDGFVSRVPWKDDKYAGEVILEEILERYKIPTTVSVIQREFEMLQQNYKLEQRLIKTAQRIFALPWVQIATHTYSHPLRWWPLIENQLNTKYLSYPDKNYLFSFHKEIVGSSKFITKHLAPDNKKVEVILWSGDANMQYEPLKMAYQAGLKNINGMAKITINRNNAIYNLGAFGMYIGKYFHIYSPLANEFEYTDDWAKPLYAYEQLIHTLQLTETPVRYKPISIYYHFYTATDQAALRALMRVYDWSLKQSVIPLKVSNYIDKILDFNNTVIAKYADGSWLITNNNAVNEFRWPIQILGKRSFPQLQNSQNIIGFNTVNNELYIHLGHHAETRLSFADTAPAEPYLVDANAQIKEWHNIDKTKTNFVLQGYLPLHFKLANLQHCQLYQNNQLIPSTNNSYYLKGINNGTFEIQCIN